MTETGKAAAVWLISATQTRLFDIFSTPPAQRSDDDKKTIAGLEELDDTFQKHKARLNQARPELTSASVHFRGMLADVDYPDNICPSPHQVAAMAGEKV